MRGAFVVASNIKSKTLPSSFPLRSVLESHLASLPSFKAGSVELIGSSGNLVSVVGVSGEETCDQARNAAASAVRQLKKKGVNGKVVLLGESFQADEAAVLEGALFGAHSWSLKTLDKNDGELTVELESGKKFPNTVIDVEAELEARVMASLPANMLTPTLFCDRILKSARAVPEVEARVFEEDEIQRMGMQGLVIVGKGSHEKIKLLQLVYRGRPSDDSIDVALIGKVNLVAKMDGVLCHFFWAGCDV